MPAKADTCPPNPVVHWSGWRLQGLPASDQAILSAPDVPVAEPMELKAELEEIRGRRG